ncbi:hypothetical protein [Sphaerisporangium rhizosphaerae]|uniref:HK97 gp10 family phage protein n=1 Tax=Sphaerisporangium rhizosphaerae TaxID=2269375 RepID=A0ABW2NU05_9ACTN
MAVTLTVEQQALKELGRALRAETDGKAIRKDLIRQLKQPLQPAVTEIKSGVMSMASGGLSHGGEPLRAAVARKIRAEAKLSGYAVGVRVRARKTEAVRGFRNAPKRLNSPKGWRHPVFGSDRWVQQIGKPRYFDEPLEGRKAEFRRAVIEAMDSTARRIGYRIKL